MVNVVSIIPVKMCPLNIMKGINGILTLAFCRISISSSDSGGDLKF